ncbi:methyltransferase domain-containing protein [Streptomyces sp. NBC_00378]|uniref:class I SAM-dependent methyltransferase n=1 Tax=unclassified Streptomyces TaxID=2593676 RepID=UPI00224DF8C2|nr:MULTISPECIES: class I SAM-dependent methyltransferase [unclassified Streptomyces]MCX5113466.1 methyltransferase domain-containing protein [Streptomyces sp. NBC_00378]
MHMTTGPTVGDAFGEMLLECWQAGAGIGTTSEVLERDDGQVIRADAGNYFTRPEAWPDVERYLPGRVRGRVLDVGCGGGRVADVLQGRGHPVLGIDPSQGAVRLCAERGLLAVRASAADVTTLKGRSDTFDTFGTFDSIVMMGNGFGLLQSRQQAAVVLGELAAVAEPGASLFGTSLNPVGLTDPREVAYRRRNVSMGRMPGQWSIRVRHRDMVTEWFDYLFLSVEELAEIVRTTPWTLREAWFGQNLYLARLELD